MRLTLRTLLAYLDDILEDDDANALKAKIDESGIATALISRIQNSVDKREIGAISPDAIGPLENANVMGEYLDSTLSPEQIAEIERLCLESDASLSEAAACHQILTVVLGQPAQVSDRLRKRIYALPNSDELKAMEQQSPPAADTHSAKPNLPEPATYSGVEIPQNAADADPPPRSNYALANASAADLDRGADDFERDAATVIRPVGPKDSGVANASERMRKSARSGDGPGRSEAEIVAGATRAMMGRTDGYGGSIRPSRITPWLVALALAGVLFYALAQVFSPLTEQDAEGDVSVAQRDSDGTAIPVADPATESGAADSAAAVADDLDETNIPATDVGSDASPAAQPDMNDTDAADNTAGDSAAAVDSAAADDELAVDESVPTEPVPAGAGAMPTAGGDSPGEPGEAEDPQGVVPESTSDSPTDPASESTGDSPVDEMAPGEADGEPAPAADNVDSDEGNQEPATEDDAMDADAPAPDDATPADANSSGPTPVVAEMTQPGNLVIVRSGDVWKRLVVPEPEPDSDAATAEQPADQPTPPQPPATAEPNMTVASVHAGQTIVAPALFRPTLVNPSGIEWTLAGPTRMRIGRNDAFGAVTQVVEGRLLLASTQPDVTTLVMLGQRQLKIAMPESQTVLAIEMNHFRPLGANPLVPGNRLATYRVISVQGTVKIQAVGLPDDPNPAVNETLTLGPNEQYQGEGVQPATIAPIDRLPAWIDAAAKRDVLADSARDGLMEFTTGDEPIEKSLREGMTFRRVEVAALAAETLLLLGRADVYFGADGILHRPRQRLYWEEHVDMLRQHIDSDSQAAEAVRVAIERAELADSQRLFKLLVGFTPDELAAGADAELVQLLDSPSMAVRVLTIENLREIVGDTLAYRADQENANARKSDIKKWETRLRRGDIRYEQ
ncbi:prolipoprotein diacylglyceryl transferase [Allorhodopirellula solitaria]|uniref:Uncharacterized protein n=1 Tax=Allorhodopirellula solitaria TaxID=2527987 RepID=A0A5C5XV98_9BACT|nr:hypothetical protein [Allorhodopirellula solitaria]TWT67227.1 hypothetical protein CA85_20760 [Allorhodopirellula solitaria]